MKKLILTATTATALIICTSVVQAAEDYTLTLKDHKFTPEVLEIPAGQQVKLTIDNQDGTAEEFESHELNREQVIAANSKGVIMVGPVKAGTYDYFGEFNQDTAKGRIIAK
ncbi:MAG: cupredoxin domain-containing protein [Alphaproteobacteria bacterium]